MSRFKDIRVIDLDEEATEPTHHGWTVCFRLSANTPDEWRKVFRTVMSGSWWAPYMWLEKDTITIHRVRPRLLRLYKWAVEKNVAETNYRYREWLRKQDKVRKKQEAQVASFRQTLFGKKRKRRI